MLQSYKEIKPAVNDKYDLDENYKEMITLINNFEGNSFNKYIYRDIIRNRMFKSRRDNSDNYTHAVEEYYSLFPDTYKEYPFILK